MDKQDKNQRKRAIENILQQIREKRSGIDPGVLEQAQKAALQKMSGKPVETVPYDKAAAEKAIEIFVRQHPGGKPFRDRLSAFLKKKTH